MKPRSEPEHAAAKLRRMRAIATGGLVACAAGAALCRWAARCRGWTILEWPGAFFEAGTVGAMADWFAVVALFRHPMGIPIPHTAVLPNNKGRVAKSLATFLETSFLTEERLGPRFMGIDYAGFASRWLEKNAAMLASRAANYAPAVVSGLSDDEMSALLADRARGLIRSADVGPMVGSGLDVVTQNGRDREIFVGVLKSAHKLIAEHRGTIQAKISDEIPISGDMLRPIPFGKELAGPLLDQVRDSLASAIAGKTVEKVQATLDEAGEDSESPLWRSFDERLRAFIADLKSSPEMACRICKMQDALAESHVVEDFARKTWEEVRSFILRDCESEASVVRRKIEEAVLTASRQLAENPAARAEINAFVGEQVLATVIAAKPHVRELVTSTVDTWDAEEMAGRLEGTVGRDLQFIRVSGTLVGGAVGLAIFAIFRLMGF